MVKVSIIVPVFNGVEYIDECIESIISQTLKEIEIIIVDAGSTDGTLEKIYLYAKKDSRIILLHSDKKSMGYQTNLGIQKAQGKYIGFCEADDYVDLTMYENLYSIAIYHNLDFVKSDFSMFVEVEQERIFLNYNILDAEKKDLYGKEILPSDYPDIIYRDVNMWNGIYKREFIQNNCIKLNNTPKAAFQDIGFILQTFILADKIMYVQEKANRYRRDNIKSSVYDQKNLDFIVQELEYVYLFLVNKKIKNKRVLTVIVKRFLEIFCFFYRCQPESAKTFDEIKGTISKFREVFWKIYTILDYSNLQYEMLDISPDLIFLLKDLEVFDLYQKELGRIRQKSFNKFFNYIKKYQKAIIFGAGERGTSCLGLLKRNQYKGVVCFYDNNPLLWHTQLMGLEIKPPNEINKDNIVFIVANAVHWKEIYNQLISLGVNAEHICRAIEIIPHHAFEIKFMEESNEKNHTDCNNYR